MSIGNIDFGQWLAGGGGLPNTQWALRAQVQWNRILDKPTDVELKRKDVGFLPPQTVRVEFDDSMMASDSEIGMGAMRRVMVFGVRGHPTIDDFDVEVTDTFIMDNAEYTVMSINRQMIGQVQAYCEAVG